MSEKLSCHVVEDLLPLYLDGVVSEATGQDIEEHLAGCPACAAKLEELHAPVPELAGDDREDDAIRRAAAAAKPGDVVILSPASASFDCFKNFMVRGEEFKKTVLAL